MSVLNFRKYARVEVDIPVQVAIPGSQEPRSAHLNNISEEGASLISKNPLPIAITMELDIQLPKIKLPAHVCADILWSRAVDEDGNAVYVHGLLFNRIGCEDRERLHEFISNSMSY